jgi:pimeloyl-ACP methyl ester carboxylesterase
LVLYGEHDAGLIRRQWALLRERISDAELVEVPDAGHASSLDNPGFVTEQLRTFLGERASQA